MWGFGATAARVKKVDVTLAAFVPAMESLTGGERAAVLLLSCIQSGMLAETYGEGIVSTPVQFPDEAAAAADGLMEMLTTAERLVGDAPLAMARYLRVHSTSLLVLLATVSVGLPADASSMRSARSRAAMAWKMIWATKASAEPALSWLRRGEAASGVPCFPRLEDRRLSDLDVLGMVRLPIFLIRKPTTKPAAKIATA